MVGLHRRRSQLVGVLSRSSGRGLATSVGSLLASTRCCLAWTHWLVGGRMEDRWGWSATSDGDFLPIVSTAMGRPATESLVLLALAIVIMARRMQGNPDSGRECVQP